MTIEEKMEWLKDNYESVYMKFMSIRLRYRLHMGKFDPDVFLEEKPFIGLHEYWTMEGSTTDLAIAAAYQRVKNSMLARCGLSRL